MRTTAPLALLFLAACTEPKDAGPLKIGIVSGNNQQAPAATAVQLPAPIVGKLVRLPNGTVAWQQRAIDALLPAKAYAQTQDLQGSPVAGAVVCAKAVEGPVKLEPVVPCTNTAADGTATFAFTHGTTAGTAKAVVQGMLNGIVATFDTATAIVTPGAVAVFGGWPFSRDTLVDAGQVLDFNTFPLTARDKFGNVVSVYVFKFRRFNTDNALMDAAPIVSRLVTIRGGDTLLHVWADTALAGPIHVRVRP